MWAAVPKSWSRRTGKHRELILNEFLEYWADLYLMISGIWPVGPQWAGQRRQKGLHHAELQKQLVKSVFDLTGSKEESLKCEKGIFEGFALLFLYCCIFPHQGYVYSFKREVSSECITHRSHVNNKCIYNVQPIKWFPSRLYCCRLFFFLTTIRLRGEGAIQAAWGRSQGTPLITPAHPTALFEWLGIQYLTQGYFGGVLMVSMHFSCSQHSF